MFTDLFKQKWPWLLHQYKSNTHTQSSTHDSEWRGHEQAVVHNKLVSYFYVAPLQNLQMLH